MASDLNRVSNYLEQGHSDQEILSYPRIVIIYMQIEIRKLLNFATVAISLVSSKWHSSATGQAAN